MKFIERHRKKKKIRALEDALESELHYLEYYLSLMRSMKESFGQVPPLDDFHFKIVDKIQNELTTLILADGVEE